MHGKARKFLAKCPENAITYPGNASTISGKGKEIRIETQQTSIKKTSNLLTQCNEIA